MKGSDSYFHIVRQKIIDSGSKIPEDRVNGWMPGMSEIGFYRTDEEQVQRARKITNQKCGDPVRITKQNQEEKDVSKRASSGSGIAASRGSCHALRLRERRRFSARWLVQWRKNRY